VGGLVRDLVKLLEDEHADVRISAAKALGTIGGAAKEQDIRVLKGLLRDEDRQVQQSAMEALGQIAGKVAAADALKFVTEMLRDKDTRMRITALKILGSMSQGGEKAVPVIVNLLNDPEWSVRWEAARTLGKIGPKAKQSVPALIKLFAERSPIRASAVDAVVRIDPEAEQHIQALTELLREEEPLRVSAAEVLGSIGRRGKVEALPYLNELLRDKDPRVQRCAADVLATVAPAVDEEIFFAVSSLEKVDPNNTPNRLSAARELAELIPQVQIAVARLTQLLRDAVPDGRRCAPEPLAIFVPQVKVALNALVTSERLDPDPQVRKSAADALKKIKNK